MKLLFSKSVLDGIEFNMEAVKMQIQRLTSELGLPDGDSAYGTRRAIRRQLSTLHENFELLQARYFYATERTDELSAVPIIHETESALYSPASSTL